MFPPLTILLAIPAAGSTKMQLLTVFRVAIIIIIIFLVWHTQQKKFCNRKVHLWLELLLWLISSKITRSLSDLCQTQVWKEANIVEATTKLPEPSLLIEIRVFPSLYAGLTRNFLWKWLCYKKNPVLAKRTLLHFSYRLDQLNRKIAFVKLNWNFECQIILRLIHVCLILWQHLIDTKW